MKYLFWLLPIALIAGVGFSGSGNPRATASPTDSTEYYKQLWIISRNQYNDCVRQRIQREIEVLAHSEAVITDCQKDIKTISELHNRIIAEKDAEIARMKLRDDMYARLDSLQRRELLNQKRQLELQAILKECAIREANRLKSILADSAGIPRRKLLRMIRDTTCCLHLGR